MFSHVLFTHQSMWSIPRACADYAHGVLTVTVPKKEPCSRAIKVNVNRAVPATR